MVHKSSSSSLFSSKTSLKTTPNRNQSTQSPKPLIGFLDSGLGGYPYMEQAVKSFPQEEYIYVADNRGFPYGTKEEEAIRKTVLAATTLLEKRFVLKGLVLACNTASVVALKEIRATFPFPVVGVVPAVKPAAQISRSHHIGLLATRKTLKGSYLKELLKEHAIHCKVSFLDGTKLVNFIEKEYFVQNKQARETMVREQIKNFPPQMDTLVLGCTHFIYLKEIFEKNLPNIHLVDSRQGVLKRLGEVLTLSQNLEQCTQKKKYGEKQSEEIEKTAKMTEQPQYQYKEQPSRRFFLTAHPSNLRIYRKFCEETQLEYAGRL